VQDIIQKAATLVEAFPYIRSFRDKIVVVKYGGSTQPEEGGSETVLADLGSGQRGKEAAREGEIR